MRTRPNVTVWLRSLRAKVPTRKPKDISPWEDLISHTDDLTELLVESGVREGEDLHQRHRRIEEEDRVL